MNQTTDMEIQLFKAGFVKQLSEKSFTVGRLKSYHRAAVKT